MQLVVVMMAMCLSGASRSLAPCDDAKFNIKIDLLDKEAYQCSEDPWPLPETVIPSLALRYPEQEGLGYCMDRKLTYDVPIPNSGAHRLRLAQHGEYEFCPPQRWVHNLEHGTIAFLYHPCVNPRLKEELCLLARACLYKHIITPHVNLTKERPLALASWAATLEMQQVNLIEALVWLRESTRRSANHEIKGDGAYNYLLTRPAVARLTERDYRVCPETQMEMLRNHFNWFQSRQAIAKRKRGENNLTKSRYERMKRRRRTVPLDIRYSKGPVTVMLAQSPVGGSVGHSDNDRGEGANQEGGTALTPKNVMFQQMDDKTSRDNEGARLTSGVRARPSAGWNHGSEAASPWSVPEKAEHFSIHLEEEKKARVAGNPNDLEVELERRKSTVEEKRYAENSANDSAALRNSDDVKDSKGHVMVDGPGHNRSRANSPGVFPASDTIQDPVVSTAAQPPQPDHSQQKDNSVVGVSNQQIPLVAGKVNVSEPLTVPRNLSKDLVSSESDKAGDNGRRPNSTSHVEKGMLTKGGSSSTFTNTTTNEDVRDGASKLEVTDARNISTLPPEGVEKGGGTGKEQCNCLSGSSQKQGSHRDNQAVVQEGVLGNGGHLQSEQAIQRAAVDAFIRTPRTEEAAWAAAALTFLFVLLTLAVLYTRLWRKFRKSESLYWAPDSDHDGQETVSAVIKRRLTVGQARRKKRQSYKKRPLVLYENLSDSSD